MHGFRQPRAHQTENYARALDRVATMQALLSHDGEWSRVFSRGVIDPSSLTPAHGTQLTCSLYEAFGAFEFMFYASKNAAGSVHGKLHCLRGFLDQGKPDRCPSDEAIAGVHLLLTAALDQPGHSPPLCSSPPRDCGTRPSAPRRPAPSAGRQPPQVPRSPAPPPAPGHRMAQLPIVRG
jgi:hypothetical protein